MGILKKWKGLFNKENEYAEAKAEHAFDAHADPRIQIDQAIREAEEQHDKLEQLVATVVGNQHVAEAKLKRYQDRETALTRDIKAALDSGNQEAARSFATQLATVRDEVSSETAFVQKATEDALKAKTQLQENAETLMQAHARRTGMVEQIDQAAAQEQMNTATKQLTDAGSNHIVPTLEEVQNKIDERAAHAQGLAEVESTSVGVQEMEVRHSELAASADSILAEFTKAPDAPVAATPTA